MRSEYEGGSFRKIRKEKYRAEEGQKIQRKDVTYLIISNSAVAAGLD